MSKDGAPRPVRTTTKAGRVLLALEVPDNSAGKTECSCPDPDIDLSPELDSLPGTYQLLFVIFRDTERQDHIPVGKGRYPVGCPHCQAANHGFSIAKWEQMLTEYDSGGYQRLPLPARPMMVMSKSARIQIYTERAERGECLFHPRDMTADQCDRVGIQGEKKLKQGELVLLGCDDEDHDPELLEAEEARQSAEEWLDQWRQTRGNRQPSE